MESRVRIGGSGWTAFTWRGNRLTWMQQLADRAPQPVAAPRPIQPMDAEHPREIATPRAVGHGILTLSNYELWNASVWQQLQGLESTTNILDIFKTQVGLGNVRCSKIIKNPNGTFRTKTYHNCTVTDVDESETINIGTMEMPKQLTVWYTHATLA